MGTEVLERNTSATLDKFWKAVDFWNERPELLNRRIGGALNIAVCKLVDPPHVESTASILTGIKEAFDDADIAEVSATWVIDKLNGDGIEVIKLEENSRQTEPGRYLYVKKLLPRFSDLSKPCLEVVIKDTCANTATFLGLLFFGKKQTMISNFPYHFRYMKVEGESRIQLVLEDFKDNKYAVFLKKTLFKKFLSWAENGCKAEKMANVSGFSPYNKDIITFNQLYQDLKKKYATEMMKIWPGQKNPEKFVCEDVAVATYLLLLWEKEKEKQTFVDLRCGNGLLVHILNNEGHPGKGIDIKKRNIWSIYPETTKLEVQPEMPPNDFLYPEADWLIGSRSHELTAWIPIIAARSSYKCKFFINVCCPYKLNGERMDSSDSENKNYMNYLQEVCKVCGFEVRIDRLRIPLRAGKEHCLIGAERKYPEEDQQKIDESIKEYIESNVKDKCEVKEATTETCQNWSDNYWSVPSNNTELAEDIISFVTEQLLVKKRLVTVTSSSGQEKTWNAGGKCLIEELADTIPNWKLKKLRSECGGLKALLRSHYHVFHMDDEGVTFIVPKPVATNLAKENPCWFQNNHPEGCPLTDEDCPFKH